MKRKGARKILIFVAILVLLCSFSVQVFASDDFSVPDYGDSYLNHSGLENKDLIFFPLPPATSFRNYVIFYYPGNDSYYMFLTTEGVADWFAGRTFITTQPFRYYRFHGNNWELEIDSNGGSEAWWYVSYPGSTMIDATCYVDGWSAGTSAGHYLYENYTGYRTYWQLATIFKLVLAKLDDVCDFVMQHKLAFYAVMLLFVGEVISFVVHLIRKIGEYRSEKVFM